ncbi:MAG TPA: MBL fold metallo-hydrolase [Capsulimonadaceae bacterium]|nr:MBL fold metallo-hydrolase [Capsulimonadaceae bacterium]
MKITVLGSGTSHGVPMIGCDCLVCTSPYSRNKRNRPCLLVTTDDGGQILVDTPPELRLMATRFKVNHVDAVLFTHSHADHVFGLDDLRAYNFLQEEPIPLYAEKNVLEDIQRVFQYCFVPTQLAGGKPNLELKEIEPGRPLTLGGLCVLPMRVFHGSLPILAFKFGEKAAYVTDVSEIPDETWEKLKGLDVLLLDAVRRRPHPTHYHMEKALEVVAELKPKRTFFVHLSHDYDHEATNAELPDGVELAYDGQVIDVKP